jgi:hypothetical protein
VVGLSNLQSAMPGTSVHPSAASCMPRKLSIIRCRLGTVLHPEKRVGELWTGEALSVAYCGLDLIEQAFGPRTGRLNRTIAGVNPW